MNNRFLICTCLLLSSCAYMQTHKNIEEAARSHNGYELTSALELYRAGGTYYLAAEKQQLRKHYPAIYDSIFLDGNNAPTWEPLNQGQEKVYRSISAGTATILQRADGYASLDVLSDELKSGTSGWIPTLPAGAQRCKVNAEITGNSTIWAGTEAPTAIPVGIRLLSAIDRVCIDWPGTILYNTAIPVMAPFVFFHQFLNED